MIPLRKWRGLALIALVIAIVLIIIDQRVGRIRYSSDAYYLIMKNGRICAITWSDHMPLCNRRLALALSRMGFSSGSENRLIFYYAESFRLPRNLKWHCHSDTIIHIGDERHTLAFETGEIAFFPSNSPSVGSQMSTGDRVQLCEKASFVKVLDGNIAAEGSLNLIPRT